MQTSMELYSAGNSIRHMVVVKEQRRCCRPITTYHGQGMAKAGIDRSKHAVVHIRCDRPRTVQAESGVTKRPLEGSCQA
ncbi:hypothetical protein N7447_001458 [Penicillium robsamsonii]|uniref:uncharacterized protein n=1 Tax=Penicillium robsamsonii TaxID=1792511 RepID=UPI002548A61E|nr:uncharacterized protein N7447_001458 [Penicillium robsamsonii]KAJ5835432.1 hypothetical protein N7447_001458 [Penicillium robsamsonii]